MQELSHFIDGKRVPGTSGRFADVFNPATGEVQARVPLASAAELAAAVEGAKAAQPKWAATNPQRRARVMMRFVDLLNRDMDKLAEALSREHGKTLPDAKGDVIRGLEVAEFCIGAPAPAEGRVHRRRRPRHRHVLDAPAARRRRRDHAVQLPGDDPDVEVLPGDRLRQRLHPQALRARPLGAADARRADAGGGAARRRPAGRQRRQGGGRRHPRPSRHRRHRLRRLDPDRRVHLRPRHRAREARAVLRRRQEPHDRHARRRPRPGGRRAGRRRLRRRRRALHGDLGRGARSARRPPTR